MEKTKTISERIAQIAVEVNPAVQGQLHNEHLVTKGILDSLDLLSLIDKLEGEFNIPIDPEDVLAENFESIESMTRLVSRKVDAI